MRNHTALSITILPLMILSVATGYVWATALDDYVAAFDGSYDYRLVDTISGLGYKAYVLEMDSQTWRSSDDVDRPLWQHWLVIAVPIFVSDNTAMLVINGGDNDDAQPDTADAEGLIAVLTGTVVARLDMVPNQPLYFTGEGIGRSEDAIIAYSWDKFLTTGDPNWPVQLPMTKSAVRALDTVQDFCSNNLTAPYGPVAIDSFVVTGGSKRGWTTWLTAAVDNRVTAIVPIVIDMLNIEPSFRNHFAAYGFWAPAVDDYVEMNIFDWLGTAEMAELLEIVDPYEYRSRYTMPKLLINSSGDDFFLPDSAQFYFADLPGEKHLRYVPNTDHGLSGSEADALNGLIAYYQAIVDGEARPQFTWATQPDGAIHVQTAESPTQVTLWQATNLSERDFRLATIGAAWTDSVLTHQGGGLYIGQVAAPAAGWTAFFVELEFGSHTYSTSINVVPSKLPFAGDYDFSSSIDMVDFVFFAHRWLDSDCVVQDFWCEGADLNRSEFVDLGDLAVFVNQ